MALQQGIIQHIQTHNQAITQTTMFLMMSVELGMANEYVRQLSENTLATATKSTQWRFSQSALLLYNILRLKKLQFITNAKLVKKMFELYATGSVRLEDSQKF